MIFDVERPPRVSRAQAERVAIRLARELGTSKVLATTDVPAAYASDDSGIACEAPDAVVLASDERDIATTLAIANDEGVPVTPRGGGSGRVGGAVPVAGGIVLATVGLGSIRSIDRADGVARVEPGIVLSDFQDAVEREDLFYAPDPNSRTMCLLGGNAATNVFQFLLEHPAAEIITGFANKGAFPA